MFFQILIITLSRKQTQVGISGDHLNTLEMPVTSATSQDQSLLGARKFWCPNALFLVSFVGMTLNRIGMLPGGPMCRESHPLWLKNSTFGNLMVTCRLSSCNPECTMYTCLECPKGHMAVCRERKDSLMSAFSTTKCTRLSGSRCLVLHIVTVPACNWEIFAYFYL